MTTTIKEDPALYVNLTDYARERGVNVQYVRGAVYSHGIRLPIIAGCFVVTPEARKALDPICDRIRKGVEASPHANGSRRLDRSPSA